MAKILNSTFGEISGKLGGMVFSRNAGGSYLRANVKGVNPQTQSQLKARNAFASVSTLFRTLTSAEKTAWQEFADNWYSPRSGGNTGQFSAYNAFIALRSAVQQALRLAFTPEFTINGAIVPATITTVPFTPMPEMPLAIGLAPGYIDVTEQSQVLSLIDAKVTFDGKFEINMQVGDGSGSELENLEDVYGNNLGYAVYISNGNPADNMAYSNEFAKCLGFATPFKLTTPSSDLDAVENIRVSKTTALNTGEFKRFPLLNEYVNVTVLVMNKYGMFARLGSIETVITTAL